MSEIKKMTLANMPEEELFYGHKACPGCGGSLAVRLVMKVLGPNTFVVVPANCMSAVSFYYPAMNFGCNALASAFPCTAATMSGIEAAARAKKIEDYSVVGFAGDGGTADIGLQALSGAIDRNDRIIYVCYDNEAYMNTGVQESGLTPFGAKTTTSPAGSVEHGKLTHKKKMFEIIAAHGIPYAATASVGYPQDLINKVEKAKACKGTSFLHIMAPCPTGWSTPIDTTVSVAKEAVECGLWYLAEYEGGQFKLNKEPKIFQPVSDYLRKQGRFKHLNDDEIVEIERQRNTTWNRIREQWK